MWAVPHYRLLLNNFRHNRSNITYVYLFMFHTSNANVVVRFDANAQINGLRKGGEASTKEKQGSVSQKYRS